jgi:DNA mismatch repair protein MutS
MRPLLLQKGMIAKRGERGAEMSCFTLGKEFLEGIEARESERTGITSLKISLITFLVTILRCEIRTRTKCRPNGLESKHLLTLKDTSELKEYEAKILVPKKIHKIESELFEQLVIWIATYIKPVQLNASLVAQPLFVFFTQLALENKYVCPDIDESLI